IPDRAISLLWVCEGDTAGNFFADYGGDFRTKKFNRPQQFIMRHCPHAQLQQETLMIEDRMLEEDSLYHIIRATDEVCPTQFRRGDILLTTHRRPPTLTSDFIHHNLHRRERNINRLFTGIRNESMRID